MRLLLEFEGSAKRVNWEGDNIRMDDLKTIITNEFAVEASSIQIYDANFNAFCDLNNHEEIKDLSRLKIIKKTPEAANNPNTVTDARNGVEAVGGQNLEKDLNLRQDGQWKKDNFTLKSSDFCLVNRAELNEADDLFKTNQKLHKASYKLKKEVMDILSNELCKYTVYPTETMYYDITEKLVTIFPFLKDPIGSANGGWKIALKYKMQEIRRKVNNNETIPNVGKRSKANPGQPGPNAGIKKPKRGEINYLPDFPKGETVESLLQHKTILENEWTKASHNKQIVNSKMDITFSLRRKQIVNEKPPLGQLKIDWPMLFAPLQLQREMNRISGVNVKTTMTTTLNDSSLKNVLKKKFPNEDTNTPEALLKLIPKYFKEKWSFFLDVDNTTIEPIPEDAVIVRSAQYDNMWAIMGEGILLVDGLDFISAVSALLEVYYSCNLQYPTKGDKSLQFIQQGLCNIEVGKCPQSVKALIRDMML